MAVHCPRTDDGRSKRRALPRCTTQKARHHGALYRPEARHHSARCWHAKGGSRRGATLSISSQTRKAHRMTDHLPIQDPDDWSPEALMRMAEALFAPLTPVPELERICMTLAHLPTEDAQNLLARFRASPRASEVSWLECAIDEGAFHLLTPTNALEERELLTLKVIEDLENELVDLDCELQVVRLARDKAEIRRSALEVLADAGSVHPDELEGLRCGIRCDENRIEALTAETERKEAMIEILRASITTPRYRNADPSAVRCFHLDGER